MPRVTLVAALAAVTLLPGCITLFSKTEVVRGDEPRRPVRFESQEAADQFHTALKARDREVGGTYLGVPFVTLYERDRKLSDTAAWNDAVQLCDADQDGLISKAEADVFAKWPNS